MEELITGENKTKFEEWYKENIEGEWYSRGVYLFYETPFEMRIGVYLAYYDSLGYKIEVDGYYNEFVKERIEWGWELYVYRGKDDYFDEANTYYKSRNEAHKEAFKQANELINLSLAGKQGSKAGEELRKYLTKNCKP